MDSMSDDNLPVPEFSDLQVKLRAAQEKLRSGKIDWEVAFVDIQTDANGPLNMQRSGSGPIDKMTLSYLPKRFDLLQNIRRKLATITLENDAAGVQMPYFDCSDQGHVEDSVQKIAQANSAQDEKLIAVTVIQAMGAGELSNGGEFGEIDRRILSQIGCHTDKYGAVASCYILSTLLEGSRALEFWKYVGEVAGGGEAVVVLFAHAPSQVEFPVLPPDVLIVGLIDEQTYTEFNQDLIARLVVNVAESTVIHFVGSDYNLGQKLLNSSDAIKEDSLFGTGVANQISGYHSGGIEALEQRFKEEAALLNSRIAELEHINIDQNNKLIKVSQDSSRALSETSEFIYRSMEARQGIKFPVARKAAKRTPLLQTVGRNLLSASRSFGRVKNAAVIQNELELLDSSREGMNSVKALARGSIPPASPLSSSVMRSGNIRPRNSIRWGLLHTPHTAFLAETLKVNLARHGYTAELMTSLPPAYDLDMYIVLCPQFFSPLPSGGKCIQFQLEQSCSSRWFTEEYLLELQNSIAVFEYTQSNLEFLEKNGVAYPLVFHTPVGALEGKAILGESTSKECDLLFYGDAASSPRRRRMLEALSEHFVVRVCENVFGEEMQCEIRKAKFVINLHYYENAFLETPRICEVLSLGTPLISETTEDAWLYPEFTGVVTFFPEGDVHSMIEAVRLAMAAPPSSEQIRESVRASQAKAEFALDRALVALKLLDPDQITDLPLAPERNVISLSLPETHARRSVFVRSNPLKAQIFDGARFRPGWMGCALSFSWLAGFALRHNLPELIVMEDDVLLPHDIAGKMERVRSYLTRLIHGEGLVVVFDGRFGAGRGASRRGFRRAFGLDFRGALEGGTQGLAVWGLGPGHQAGAGRKVIESDRKSPALGQAAA